ncbi:MAG: DUF11 domain-containing protein [Chloroflexi bacterium]|nr:DUF11 domain-containing protein [Chloroflexota bacterium]
MGASAIHAQAGSEPLLRLSKSASTSGPVRVGDTYRYELCYQNTGNAGATDTILYDELPRNVDYIQGSVTDDGVYTAYNHRITWAWRFSAGQ